MVVKKQWPAATACSAGHFFGERGVEKRFERASIDFLPAPFKRFVELRNWRVRYC